MPDNNLELKEYETELIEAGILRQKSPSLEDIKLRVFKVILIEDEGGLGKRLYDYATMVDWDYNALLPLINREPNFISQIENMSFLEFYAMRAQTMYFKETGLLLQSINEDIIKLQNIFLREIHVPAGTIDKDAAKEWQGKSAIVVEDNITKSEIKKKSGGLTLDDLLTQ